MISIETLGSQSLSVEDHFREMKMLGDSSTDELKTVRWVWMLRLMAGIALSLSVYLAWVSLVSGKVAGCGNGNVFDCSPILHSRWSTIFGLPVSVPASLLYALVFTLLLVPEKFQRLANFRWWLISLAAFTAGLAAIWFIGLQVLWLRHLGPYCLGVHACGLVMAGLLAWKAPAGQRENRRLACWAILPIAILIICQIAIQAPDNFLIIEHPDNVDKVVPKASNSASPLNTKEKDDQIFESPLNVEQNASQANLSLNLQIVLVGWLNPIALLSDTTEAASTTKSSEGRLPQKSGDSTKPRTVKILNNLSLDVSKWPLLGSPNAKYIFVEMLDYTCPHCQNTHIAIRGAMTKYGDQLAVIILPVPMNASCNAYVKTTPVQHSESCELAKVAIAVWHLEPTKFADFHNWLLESKPLYTVALHHAGQLVGEDRIRNELKRSIPSDFIAAILKLYQRAGTGVVPKLMFPSTTAVGEMRSANSLIALIEKELGSPN